MKSIPSIYDFDGTVKTPIFVSFFLEKVFFSKVASPLLKIFEGMSKFM
jgi:hypothetical protein